MPVPIEEQYTSSDSGGVAIGSLLCSLAGGTPAINTLSIIQITSDYDGAASPFTTPSGWTLMFSAGGTLADSWTAVFYKVNGSSESTTETILHSVANAQIVAAWHLYSGINWLNPINIIGSSLQQSGSATITLSSITTTEDDCLLRAVGCHDGGDGNPYSGTAGWSVSSANSGSTSTDAEHFFASKELATAGASGDLEITASNTAGMAGFLYAIEPAPLFALSGVGNLSELIGEGSTIFDITGIGNLSPATGFALVTARRYKTTTLTADIPQALYKALTLVNNLTGVIFYSSHLVSDIPVSEEYNVKLILTGVNDSLPDYEFLLENFNINRVSGETSYHTYNGIYFPQVKTEYDARPNGELILSFNGVEILRSNPQSLRYSDTVTKDTFIIKGTKQITNIDPQSINYIADTLEEITFTQQKRVFKIHGYTALSPLDNLIYLGETIQIERVKISHSITGFIYLLTEI